MATLGSGNWGVVVLGGDVGQWVSVILGCGQWTMVMSGRGQRAEVMLGNGHWPVVVLGSDDVGQWAAGSCGVG